jgi:hypothetical protein
MNIPYSLHSKFTVLCQEGIATQQGALNAGQEIHIALEAGGYSGKINVAIDKDNLIGFETDWSASDPSRFPARLKAAATALRDSDNLGRFEISHSNSVISISKAI